MGAVYLAGRGPRRGVHLAGPRAAPLDGRRAIRLFSFSNTYLALLFAAMALDAVVRGGA